MFISFYMLVVGRTEKKIMQRQTLAKQNSFWNINFLRDKEETDFSQPLEKKSTS